MNKSRSYESFLQRAKEIGKEYLRPFVIGWIEGVIEESDKSDKQKVADAQDAFRSLDKVMNDETVPWSIPYTPRKEETA